MKDRKGLLVLVLVLGLVAGLSPAAFANPAVESLVDSTDEKVAERAAKALADLDEAAALDGEDKLDALEDAAKELSKIDSPLADQALTEIVDLARTMADEAIAAAAGSDADKLAKAEKYRARAEEKLAEGKPHYAIKYFAKALKYAQKAMKYGPAASGPIASTTIVGSGSGKWAEYAFTLLDIETGWIHSVTGSNQEGAAGFTGASNEGYLFVDGDRLQEHVSCSDAFGGGVGAKSDPSADSRWRVISAEIVKVKDGEVDKACHLAGLDIPVPDPDDFSA